MSDIKSYPKSETLMLLNESSDSFSKTIEDLTNIGYEFISILLGDDKKENLSLPKVAIVELDCESPNSDLKEIITKITEKNENIRITAVYTKPLKYSQGEVKKLGLHSLFFLQFDRELFINEIFDFAPIDIPSKTLNLDTLARVNIIELEGQPLPFNLYVYLPSNKKTILYRPKGEVLDDKSVEKFKKYSHYNLYIAKSDLSLYKKHCAKILKDIQANPDVPQAIRSRKVAGEIKKLMGGFFSAEDLSTEDNKQIIDNTSRVLDEFIQETCKNKSMLKAAETIAGEHMTNYTHSRNVATYCTLFGMSKGIGTPEELHMGGLLHDIGMGDLPEEMLWKNESSMTDQEWAQYKLHPGNGRLELMSKKINVTDSVLNMVLQHHERPDGSGFPYGLEADEIDPLAKVCAFADEFDRLTSIRQGQKQYIPVAAVERISGQDGEAPLPIYEENFHSELINDFSNEENLKLKNPLFDEQKNKPPIQHELPELEENFKKKTPKVPVFETAGSSSSELEDPPDSPDIMSDMLGNFETLITVDDNENDMPEAKQETNSLPLTKEEKIQKMMDEALLEAAQEGSLKAIELSLSAGADINATNEAGNTALMLAAEYGYENIADHLINSGADIDLLNNLNKTAIDIAESADQKNLLSAMEKFKEVSITKKPVGDTSSPEKASKNLEPTDLQTSIGHLQESQNKEVDINKRNKSGQTMLMQMCSRGKVDVVNQLLKMGAKLEDKDFKGHTSLIFAAFKGHTDIVKLLIAEGANVNVKDSSGRSALAHAIEHNNTDIVEELLINGAKPNFRLKGLTLLMIAAYMGQLETAKLLIKYGASVTDKDLKGKTAVEYALVKGHISVAEFINDGSIKKTS